MAVCIPKATIDFESRSACSLKAHGVWRYSIHPSTQILCLVFRLPHWAPGRTSVWHPEMPALGLEERAEPAAIEELFDWIADGGLVEAHNVWFEYCIWQNVLHARHGWPAMPLEQWRCSAAKAAAHALPRALGDAAKALKLALLKDEEGAKAMKKLAKPRKSRKAERAAWAAGAPQPDYLWWESVDLLDRLIAYCRVDVLAEEALSHVLDDLSPEETQMFLMDLRINARGFQLDKRAVQVALRLIHQEAVVLNQELTLLTDRKVRKATQRAQMLSWFMENGLELFDTQKGTIDDLLTKDEFGHLAECDPKVRRALEIMRALGRSSTAKYRAMKDWMAPNGRVFGGLLYHGASTGRWSGKGIQPHNFTKPTFKHLDVNELWFTLKLGNRNDIRAKYGDVMEALSNGLRGAITAAAGLTLYCADYASIEARVLLWVADDQDGLDLFRHGKDMYLDMADAIYGYHCTKEDNPTERAVGKIACLGPDTLVVTHNGPKRIVDVTSYDHLWDGEAWVLHDGTVCNGIQKVIDLAGISLTQDHLVLTGKDWKPASEVARNADTLSRALASGSAPSPWQAMLPVSAVVSDVSSFSATAGIPATVLRELTLPWDVQPAVTPALSSSQPRIERSSGATQISCPTTSTGTDYSTESVQSTTGARTLVARTTRTTGAGAFVCGLRGSVRKVAVALSHISSLWWVGIMRIWTWIVSTTTKGTNPTIFGSSPEQSTLGTDGRSKCCNNASPRWSLVYDIMNAGPRHRFAVLTERGPVIVHNCLGLGYQMGASKFVSTCEIMGGVIITEEFSKQVVDAYREKYWKVKQLWNDQEAAAIKAVTTGKRVFAGKVVWFTEGRFLYCQLPSGRRLAYPYPEAKLTEMRWGGQKVALSFMGVDGYTRKWKRQTVYGGLIVENLVQAIARDLMAHGMALAEAHPNYQIILSIHDELLAESPKGVGSVHEFETLMSTTPSWAKGCPVSAEGWSAYRYHK